MSSWKKSKSHAPKARKKVNKLSRAELREAITIAYRNGQEKGQSQYWQQLMRAWNV